MVLLPLSDATTPSMVRSRGRLGFSSVAAAIVHSLAASGDAKRSLLCRFQFALTDDRLDPRDFLARLLELAGIFQLLGHCLRAQIEHVLVLLREFRGERCGITF